MQCIEQYEKRKGGTTALLSTEFPVTDRLHGPQAGCSGVCVKVIFHQLTFGRNDSVHESGCSPVSARKQSRTGQWVWWDKEHVRSTRHQSIAG
jgi:hypothetical protein